MHAVVLVIHVVAGGLGLAVGPAAMLAPKRPGRHPLFGRAYQALTGALCLSAFGLVAYRPSLWWLGVIGAVTWAAALAGWWVRRAAFRGWVTWHINLMCSSYLSFVTAFLVVNLGLTSPVAWILPSAVGSPLIARATIRSLRPRAAEPEPAPAPAPAPAPDRAPARPA